MKRRRGDNKYPDDLGYLVQQASRENREICLSKEDFRKLGHKQRPLLKVMRAFCMDCMGGSMSEIKKCTSIGCDLWPYRMGKDPFRRRRAKV